MLCLPLNCLLVSNFLSQFNFFFYVCVDALISASIFQLVLMKPLGYHHLNGFSRTCSYPPVLLLKGSCSNLCSLAEKKRLIDYTCVYFGNPRSDLISNLITGMLSSCWSLYEPDVPHITCALLRKIQAISWKIGL